MNPSGKQKLAGFTAALVAATGLITAVHGTHTTTSAHTDAPVVVTRPHDANGSPLPVTASPLGNGQTLIVVGHGTPCSYRQQGPDPLRVLPDPDCTPGARNPHVTQANIGATICRTGWTATIRPPQSVTSKIKRQALADYGLTSSASATTELDHLLPLEVGGAPADPRNLWPEPNYAHPPAPYVHNPKDAVELQVRNAVCRGQVSLATAQAALLTNWTTAKQVLHIGKPTPTPSRTP